MNALGMVETKGLVLTQDGRVIEAFYHSTCGGHTCEAQDVFGLSMNGITGISDKIKSKGKSLCVSSPHYNWKFSIEEDKIFSALQQEKEFSSCGQLKIIEIAKTNKSGRVISLKLTGVRSSIYVSGYNFWQIMGDRFGWGKFKSAWFKIFKRNNTIIFQGKGLGHGLGMCQTGAMEMAKKSYNHRQILKHYFPHTVISRASNF
jgi:stage II sporulation protein D